MNSRLMSLFLLFGALGCQSVDRSLSLTMPYLETRHADVVDDYFGHKVPDPYRWLEDDLSAETAAWVRAQNKVTFDYLSQIPYRDEVQQRLTKLWNYEKRGAPFHEGDYTYFYANDGLQNQDVLYRYKKGTDLSTAEVFLDPNTFSGDGTMSLGQVSFTKDGSLVAYTVSEGGSDWRTIYLMNAATREFLEAPLQDVKFSGVAWLHNDGFYYSSYDKPEGSELSAKTDQHKLYFHRLGTSQTDDEVVFGAKPDEKHRYVWGGVTEDQRFLQIDTANSTSGNKLMVQDLDDPKGALQMVLDHEQSDTHIVLSRGDTLYLLTNLDAPNKRLVRATLGQLDPAYWQDVIPESEHVLSVSTAGEYFFAHRMVDALSEVTQYDLAGQVVRYIELPGLGSAGGFGAKLHETETYYSFSNYFTPSSIYKMDLASGKTESFWQPGIEFEPNDYVSEQVFYTSEDGTRVPMMLSYKKGLKRNGQNPTILYGYGGFNVSLTPAFSVTHAVWMDMGGIFAVANLRGGGEYGKAWHNAGTKLNKQNVFDDFIAAADYLFEHDYTSNKYLALRGGSNGGLLVGAVMTQRPDLAQVALPAVGVLDMLRYHTFTSGAGWAYDYGTSEQSEEMFQYLLGYSPLHNIQQGVEYPATLVTTGDHDDRVVPAHSFKFAAELQAKHAGDHPVMIRVETDAGHGAGKPLSKIIAEQADILSFTLFNMGVQQLQ